MCRLERESWLISWCPGTRSYISAGRPKDFLDLVVVEWRCRDLRFNPSLPVATNKWQSPGKYARGTTRND
jgi:hypothetical protein